MKYSSKAEFGDTVFRGFLADLGGPVDVVATGGAGGGDASVAGTSKSVDFGFEMV